jgi:hypothetical protein
MDLKNQILVALGLDKEEVLMAFQAKLEDGTIITSTADELIAGVDISVLTEDGSVMLLPVGNYVLESGESFSVEEEGIVSEVFGAEDVEEEAPVEEEVEMAEEADVADWEGMEKRIANLENAIADLKGEEKDTEEEVEEMSVETEVEERGTTPKSIKTTEVVEFSMEDLQAENDRLKTELAAQPASAPLDTNKFSSEKTSLSKKELKMMTSQERFLYNLNN